MEHLSWILKVIEILAACSTRFKTSQRLCCISQSVIILATQIKYLIILDHLFCFIVIIGNFTDFLILSNLV